MLIKQEIIKNDLEIILNKTKEYNIETALNYIKQLKCSAQDINMILFERYNQKQIDGTKPENIIERTLLILLNEGLIYLNLKNYFGFDEDLYSVGKWGLIRAIDTYSIEQYAFTTYAVKVIFNEILSHVRSKGLKLEGKGMLSSLNSFVGDGDSEDCELINIIPDEDNFVEEVIEADFCEYIKTLFVYLKPFEQKIIIYSFGLFNQPILTQTEICKMLDVTQSHISKTLTKVSRKLYNIIMETAPENSEDYLKLIKKTYPLVKDDGELLISN